VESAHSLTYQKEYPLQVSGGCLLLHDQVLGPISPVLKKVSHGVLHLSVLEEGTSLTLNENCDPTVRSDMKRAMTELFGDSDDIKGAVVGSSLDLVISNGHIVTGTWQGIYVCVWGTTKTVTIRATILSSPIKGGKFSRDANYRGAHDITQTIADCAPPKKQGILTCVLQHTSASITINQHSKECERNLETGVNYLVPEKWNNMFFEHTYEGPDDMPGHMKSTLIGAHFTLPVVNGLNMGEEQKTYLFEHRNTGGWGGGHHRKVAFQFIESSSSQPFQRQMEAKVWNNISTDIAKWFSAMKTQSSDGVIYLCSLHGDTVFLPNCDKDQCTQITKSVTKVTTSKNQHFSEIFSSLFRSTIMLEVSNGVVNVGKGVNVWGGQRKAFEVMMLFFSKNSE